MSGMPQTPLNDGEKWVIGLLVAGLLSMALLVAFALDGDKQRESAHYGEIEYIIGSGDIPSDRCNGRMDCKDYR